MRMVPANDIPRRAPDVVDALDLEREIGAFLQCDERAGMVAVHRELQHFADHSVRDSALITH